jgi:hypothetical protein
MGQYSQWLYYREVEQQLQAQLEACERELAHLQERTPVIEQNGEAQEACLQHDNQIILALEMLHDPHIPPKPNGQPAVWAEASQLHAGNGEGSGRVSIPSRPSPIYRPPGNPPHTQSMPDGQHGQNSPVGADSSRPSPIYRPPEEQQESRRGTPTWEITQSEPGESISSALFAWSSLPNFAPQEVPAGAPETPVGNDLPITPFDRPLPPVPYREMALLPEDTFIDEHTVTAPQIELPWWFRNIAAASRATNSPYSPFDQESIRTNRLVQRWLERWGRQSAHDRQQQRGENPS